MGRAERRAFNRKHKVKLTREEFDARIAMARIQAGNFDFSDLSVSNDFVHMDNIELAPDGCVCKLNYEAIMSRPQADKMPEFLQWVEDHKDMDLHVTREDAVNSLICFEEDVRYRDNPKAGEKERIPRWCFDTYTDILIKTEDGTYKTILEIEDAKAEAEKKEQEKQTETKKKKKSEKKKMVKFVLNWKKSCLVH